MDVFPSQENVNLEVYFYTFYGFHIVLSTPVSPWYTEAPSVDNKVMMAPRRINHPEPGHLLAVSWPLSRDYIENMGVTRGNNSTTYINCQQKKTTKSGEEAFIKTFMSAVEIVA